MYMHCTGYYFEDVLWDVSSGQNTWFSGFAIGFEPVGIFAPSHEV